MKLLVVLSGLLACAFGQVYYYSNPYSHFAPYSPIAPLTASYVHAPYAAAPYAAAPYAAAPVVTAAPIIAPVSSQFRAQDELGQFTFATAGDNQARVETGLLDGSVRGAYSYVDANNKLINVQYLADNNGFRVLGANNLPEAPTANNLKGPEPVKDTPEVVAARAEFQKKFAEAAAAAAAAPEHPAVRRKRQVLFTPSVVAAPALAKATVRVQQFEPVDAKVPASTQKVELKESEKEVTVPFTYAAAPAPYIAAPAPYIAGHAPYVAAPHVYSVAAPHVYSVPQVVAAPALAKTTVKVQQYEPVDAKVPASTSKLELKESEHEVVAPLSYAHLPYYNYNLPFIG